MAALDETPELLGTSSDLPKAYSPSELKQHLLQGDQIIGAFAQQHLVGFSLYRDVCGEAELLFLYVIPKFRRDGVGTRLLQGFIEDLKRKGVRRVFLEVSEVNSAAIQLYQNSSFKIVGTRERYYSDGSSALVMSRCLEDIAD